MSFNRVVWRLKKGSDRRIRGGHPWVFSNELQESPKGIAPGSAVELLDCQGQFLARGYGNPASLIAFRALTLDPDVLDPWSTAHVVERLIQSWRQRRRFGFNGSFRLCFSENDFLPGLVIDYYVVKRGGTGAQIFCVQMSTAGMQAMLPDLSACLQALVEAASREHLSEITWENTGIVLRNDVSIRKLEGLEPQAPQVLRDVSGVDLGRAEIAINDLGADGAGKLIWMTCNLADGQKTGFFLDQVQNIRLVSQLLSGWRPGKVRILDLCCYVGHWSVQLANTLKRQGHDVEITLVDVSEPALAFAKGNVEKLGLTAKTEIIDVLQGLDRLASQSFDIVIADPPAFIKAKKDLPTGKHAYFKLNAQAFRLVASGGLVVSCSCSGHLSDEDLSEALRKATQRNRMWARGVLKGGHSPDHPTLPQFPEGSYLKMQVHSVE
jgi:23S rRNA (cytosine1962-C5)-methyltransferase